MKLFSRNKNADNKKINKTSPNNNESLMLLLIRPRLGDIFNNNLGEYGLSKFGDELDKLDISTLYFISNHGICSINRVEIDKLFMIPILFISESGRIGYTITMRLDMQVFINKLIEVTGISSGDYLDYFSKYDAVIVANGAYKGLISFDNAEDAMRIKNDGFSQEFEIANVVYFATIADNKTINGLRELEDVAKHILFEYQDKTNSNKVSELPKLPDDVFFTFKRLFLDFIFDRARQAINK